MPKAKSPDSLVDDKARLRFLAKFEKRQKSMCWWWKAQKDKNGYGRMKFKINGRHVATPAHRVSWEIYRSPIPKGMLVCHRCDNPSCVNPHHLFLGTWMDNYKDMENKGRRKSSKGSSNGSSRLNEKKVIEIRFLRAQYGSASNWLSAKFNISSATISRILSRQIWKHI